MANFIYTGFADEISSDLTVQLENLRKNNMRFIEMRAVNDKSILDHSIAEVKEIKQQLDAYGVKLSAVGSYLGKQPINEPFTHAEKFKYTLEIADILEAKNIRIFSFYIPKGEAPADYKDEVMSRLSYFTENIKDTGIKLLHENEAGIYGDSAERCLEIAKAFYSDSFALIFDPANFVHDDFEPYPHAWNLLKDYVEYMHIKDMLYENHEMRPAGYGDGKIFEILSDLNQREADIFLSIEPHLANFSGFASLERNRISLPAGNNIEKFDLAKASLDEVLKNVSKT